MTTYDREMLANEALAVLFRDGGSGQEPAAEDVEYVDERIDAVLAELEQRGVVSVPDVDDIEPAHFRSIAMLLAQAVANHFGKPVEKAAIDDAEERLKIMVQNTPPARNTLDIDPALKGGPGILTLQRWTRGG